MNVFVSRVIIELGWYPIGPIPPLLWIRRGYTNLGTAENLSDDRIWKSSFPDKLIWTALWNLSIGEGFVNLPFVVLWGHGRAECGYSGIDLRMLGRFLAGGRGERFEIRYSYVAL